MADLLMWHQGAPETFSLPNCGEMPAFDCPRSRRIAAEYMRDFYFLSNVLNPNWDNGYFSRENWQQKFARDVKVGDTIWFILVPPKHRVIDVAVYAEETLTEGSALASLGGLNVEVVMGVFEEADDTGRCEPIYKRVFTDVYFPSGEKPEEVFYVQPVDFTTLPNQWCGIGLTITSMPDNQETLEFIRSRLVVGAHVYGYDAQVTM